MHQFCSVKPWFCTPHMKMKYKKYKIEPKRNTTAKHQDNGSIFAGMVSDLVNINLLTTSREVSEQLVSTKCCKRVYSLSRKSNTLYLARRVSA